MKKTGKTMTPPICWLSGRFVESRSATVPALDRGFLFGEGLFETWRTYRGRPFAVEEHVARIAKSAKRLGIPFDPNANWKGRTRKLARLNHLLETGGAVRLTITRGPGPVSLIPSGRARPTQLMLFRPLEPNLDRAKAEGVGVHVMDFGAGVNAGLRQLKTLNYLPAVMGKLAARERGCFESLYMLADTTMLEGTTTNFFIVKRGRLITPPVAEGILPGVTRGIVIKLASRLVQIVEKKLKLADLLSADEVFLTSSTIEVVPVLRVDRRRVAAGQVGKLTRELQQRYRRYAAKRLGVTLDELAD
jgi:D-amino acid aminotransferase